jgi:predicted outer membrane lipoprotein
MIYLYWILGVVGYVCMGVITALAFFYIEDSEPDGRAGTLTLL